MKQTNKRIILLILILSVAVNAQTGPSVECINCEQYTRLTTPVSGVWWNPEQSGVGISIEVQKNTLFGVYYGYNDLGLAVWYTFVGKLKKSKATDVMFEIIAPLKQFQNGTCANCDYTKPTQTNFDSTINLKFNHKNLASFSVNEGNEQNIIPIVFSSESAANFSEMTSFPLPELGGFWTFTYNLIFPNYPEADNFVSSETIGLGTKRVKSYDDGTMEVLYDVVYWYPLETLSVGEVSCKTSLNNNQIVGPDCTYTNRALPYDDDDLKTFRFPLGGIGDKALFGENPRTDTFQASKLETRYYHHEKNKKVLYFDQLPKEKQKKITKERFGAYESYRKKLNKQKAL